MPDFPLSDGFVDESFGVDTANSSGTTITAGTANTKGSYTELVASTGADAKVIFVALDFGNGTTASVQDSLVDIATGAGGSEIVILSNLCMSKASAFNSGVYIFPIHIPSGTRLSARLQSNTAGQTVFVSGRLGSGGFLFPQPGSEVFTYGANTADSGGVSVDPGGTANTLGSWTEITSSSDALSGFIVAFGNRDNAARTACNFLVNIGIGAAASEQTIVSNIALSASGVSDFILPTVSSFYPIQIPSGTRLSARAQSDIIDATDRLMDVIIYGVG